MRVKENFGDDKSGEMTDNPFFLDSAPLAVIKQYWY